jgi:hypothetical protein
MDLAPEYRNRETTAPTGRGIVLDCRCGYDPRGHATNRFCWPPAPKPRVEAPTVEVTGGNFAFITTVAPVPRTGYVP